MQHPALKGRVIEKDSIKTIVFKKAPFLRLFIFLAIGILLQWEFQLDKLLCWCIFICGALLLTAFLFLPLLVKFKFIFITAITVFIVMSAAGALLTYYQDIRHDPHWIGKYKDSVKQFVAIIKEEPLEKAKSFKAKALIEGYNGGIIIYFQKEDSFSIKAFSTLVFKKPLQEIRNSPALKGFNYKQFCLFNGITYQVYLRKKDYKTFRETNSFNTQKLLLKARSAMTRTLKKFIPDKQEAGLAEALLVGYKNDLDRSLVQSYSNTGVVHIIAISGLHLCLIYWMLLLILKPLSNILRLKWLAPLLVLLCLWTFSFLAGAQPSVLRAAFMFSVLLAGELAGRKSFIVNSLSLSAFFLLCINPFWLWDIGFQLSYAAVLSIIIFMKPIYNIFYFKNTWIDYIWKLNAVTLSAQILTTPIAVYHFHQFPNFFLLSNCIAVPLSSLVLFSEILILIFCWWPALTELLGKLTAIMIRLMNGYVQWIDQLPGSLSKGLHINAVQTVFLYIIITGITAWLFYKIQKAVLVSLTALLAFLIIRAIA